MLYQVRTQLMSMMSVLDKSLTIICPDRNVKETGELRQRITKAYHESKVGRRKTIGSVTVGLTVLFQDRVHQAILIRKEIIEKRKVSWGGERGHGNKQGHFIGTTRAEEQ